MDIQDIMERAKGTPNLDAVLAVKLPQDQKDLFIKVCAKHELSVGRVMREMITEFLENA